MPELYRGVSESKLKEDDWLLKPKGHVKKDCIKYDEGFKYDQVFYGSHEINALRKHQSELKNNEQYCYLSFSRDIDIARKFATSGNIENGYIYVVEESTLSNFNIECFDLESKSESHEQEVSLRTENCNPIPEECIIRIIKASVS